MNPTSAHLPKSARCLVRGCGTPSRKGPICGSCRDDVPTLMLLLAVRNPALWLDVARYVEGLRAERRAMRGAA